MLEDVLGAVNQYDRLPLLILDIVDVRLELM